MTTADEHARILLSAVIPDRRDLLDVALRHLTPEHFPDLVLRNLFVFASRYSERTASPLTRQALADMLRGRADTGRALLYLETFDALHASQHDEADFRWSLHQLRELAAERATGEALTQAMEILNHGADGDKGERLHGHAAARHHVLSRFAEIDRNLAMQEAPEGDMRAEADEVLTEYDQGAADRAAGINTGVDFGIPTLDAKVNGLHNGELVLVVGYTNEGKTHLAVQLAWHAAVMQQTNVVIFTTETVRGTVRRRLISRHSCLDVFGIEGGLNSAAIKNFTLTPDERRRLDRVVTDLRDNPDYGRIYIAQVPRGATVATLEAKLTRLQRMFPVGLVVMDSLYHLKGERRRQTDREELAGILKDAKQLATTFDDGRGVPIVSPWQVSRQARLEARQTQSYSNNALSETAEASNSPDLVISLLAPLDNESRTAPLKMQVMKARDGEKCNAIDVEVDYAVSRFTAKGGINHAASHQIISGDYASLLG